MESDLRLIFIAGDDHSDRTQDQPRHRPQAHPRAGRASPGCSVCRRRIPTASPDPGAAERSGLHRNAQQSPEDHQQRRKGTQGELNEC